MLKSNKILVLAEDYPDLSGSVSLMYIHTRNIQYVKRGFDVVVLNFSAETNYQIDGIRVITERTYDEEKMQYGLLILHAANLKNYFRFLLKNGKRIKKFLFFYHGHEVMRINRDYSRPYKFKKRGSIEFVLQDIYDSFKLLIWRMYLPRVAYKSYYVFVSEWMLGIFKKNLKISCEFLDNRYDITYNNVGKDFEVQHYDDLSDKKYDFVTIRANLDESKYAVDIVNRLAKNSPNCKFLLIGKGEYFLHYDKAENLEWRDIVLSHGEIIPVLQSARFGLMPTRTDAQGLMMCEMAAFGIPVITSDIQVCHEVFDGFKNVWFIDNDDLELSIEDFKAVASVCCKDDRFFMHRTVKKEISVISKLLKE